MGRSDGEGTGYPLQYSGLENSMDYSPWGRKELDTTEQFSLSFSLSFIHKRNRGLEKLNIIIRMLLKQYYEEFKALNTQLRKEEWF